MVKLKQWTQIGDDIDGDIADQSGSSVAMNSLGTRVVIGAPFSDGNNIINSIGQVRVYDHKIPTSDEWDNGKVITGTDTSQESNKKYWTRLGEIDGEDKEDKSGFSVAMSSDGKIIAIGSTKNTSSRGHVRVYEENNDGAWIKVGSDIDGEENQDQSGYSVAMSTMSSGDTRIAIGAPYNDGDSGSAYDNRGYVRLYDYKIPTSDEWDNGNVIAGTDTSQESNKKYWTQVGEIDGQYSSERSGMSVAMNSDGTRVAIGSPELPSTTNAAQGQVRIYEYDDSTETYYTWNMIGQLDGSSASRFGYSVALSSDGNRIAIGAPSLSSYKGIVRIFEWDDIMSAWEQVGGDIEGENTGDNSGESIAISSNGKIIAIGAIDNNYRTGHVRVYEEDNNGAWIQVGLDIDGEEYEDRSGYSVAMSSDGSKIAIGAIYNDGYTDDRSTGQVRIYQYS